MKTKMEREIASLMEIMDDMGKVLPAKARAYGGAHHRQTALWKALLEQFETGSGMYLMPIGVMEIAPRVTRCLDRIVRLVAQAGLPDQIFDEETWMDLAGDAIVGAAMVRGQAEKAREDNIDRDLAAGRPFHMFSDAEKLRMMEIYEKAEAKRAEREKAKEQGKIRNVDGRYINMDANPTPFGYTDEDDQKEAAICGRDFPTVVGTRYCSKPEGHEGRHRCERGLVDERAVEFIN